MARYIDADRFKSNLEKAMEKMHLVCGVKGVDVGAVIVALDRQPTADVVPKSEIAREIFEEIDKILNESRQGEYSKEFGFLNRVSYNGYVLGKGLAELKKKYTE